MRKLGFDLRATFDLIILTVGCGLLFGKLLALHSNFSLAAGLFFGLLAFFWYCNRQKWSVFEVGDQAVWPLVIGHLSFTIYYLLNKFIVEHVKFFNISDTTLTLGETLLVLLNLFLLNKKAFRGLRLFLNLLLLSLVLMINAQFQMTNATYFLTFSLLTLVLSLVGIWQRLKKKIMFGTSEVIAKLKHRLLSRKEQLREQQLKLPQDDPFFEAGRANSNSPEEDENEQLGHRDVLAQTQFLKESARQVDAALAKMDQGTYGVCEKCGATIEPARLEADPAATLCISCAK